jgi:hypothetical protein
MTARLDAVTSPPKRDRFDRALMYVVRALGQVNVTKLEKILYLADLEHFHRTGKTLTGARWVRYKLGPLAKRLVHARDGMMGQEISVSGEIQGDRQAQVYRPGPSPRFDPDLGPEERRDLDRIIELARPLNADQMIRLAYNTTPMRFLLSKERGKPRYNVSIPFELDLGVVAAGSAETAAGDAEERRAFKLRELERIADIQEATLARVGG